MQLPASEPNYGKVAGIDGCRGGWLMVILSENGAWEAGLFQDIASLWERYPACSRLFIDIPIGLPEDQSPRICDREARERLGPRRSSVFPPPVRAAAYAGDYREACRQNADRTGKKISRQAWNITPKIREVDHFLQTHSLTNRLLEAHPELNFLALAGRPMAFHKKKEEGFQERIEVLLPHYPEAEALVKAVLTRYPRKEVARDDIVDALCLAVNARLSLRLGLHRLPARPPKDTLGLPMQIACSA